ncbi:murein biosynthesis integral membrane protein MurJ [Thermosporothrix hazakensis]|jgi:putative peptidoglycan lipid II flippase|uniref:Murein biosynthesis integral membrane protein MurJ n=1 Tax=Thermosporothrix hazakensis TaxID=644383 RepID=A0A326UGR8_THEHA|nr:lipid II flippase MurJ [Thermosporothrix hazakensis]PZW36150.1 murein biosynthesis integral membrane protein MurJ [Thermosporothrix hazakensis]GCE46800.1 hypothetical protein KTH_16690 [Thermosporothrix hazakensis]
MSQPPNLTQSGHAVAIDSQSTGTTSARLVAVRLKSANRNIFRALLSLASANLLSRMMGMVLLLVVTTIYGQGAELDAYYVASVVALLLPDLLSGSIESSIIPVYTKARLKGKEYASRLISTVFFLFIIGLIVCTGIMLLLRQPLIFLWGPGLKETTSQLAVSLAPWIFPVIITSTLSGYIECLVNAEGQFGWAAYSRLLVPITTALFIVIGNKQYGIVMYCVGYLTGTTFQLVITMIRLFQTKIRLIPVIDLRMQELPEIWQTAWPALVGALISQAAPYFDMLFSSFIPHEGSVAALKNAEKLVGVFTGVIFTSVGRAALPYLSRQAAIKDMKAFKETLRLYLWGLGIAVTVLSLIMIVLATPIVQLLFQRGRFHTEDTALTANILIGFAIGLTPMAFGFTVSRAFSALQKTRVLLMMTTINIILNALFDAVFSFFWQSFGIALATSAYYFVSMFILLITLRRMIGPLHLFQPPKQILTVLLKLGLGPYYDLWREWREENGMGRSQLLRQVFKIGAAIVAFGAGIVGTVTNSKLAISAAFGSIVLMFLMQSPYILLLSWVGLDALIGSTIQIFNGHNLLSGLTFPTLALMLVTPIKPAFRWMPPLAILTAYVLWMLPGLPFIRVSISEFMTMWLVHLACIAVPILMMHHINTRKRMLLLVDGILAMTVFISLYGIYGYFTHTDGHYDNEIAGLFRAGSIFAAPPTLALFEALTIPLAIYRLFTLKTWPTRLLGGIVLGLMLAGLGVTFTRTTLGSVAVSIFLMLMLLPYKKLRVWLLGGAVVLFILALIVTSALNIPVFERFFSNDIFTLNGRTYLWQAVLEHFNPAAIFGEGLYSSNILLIEQPVSIGAGIVDNAPHNVFLESMYDHGFIGLTILLLLMISLPWTMIRRMRDASPEHRLVLAMGVAVFFNVFVHAFVITVMWSQQVSIYIWMILALPFLPYWNQISRPQSVEAMEVTHA